MSLFSRDMFDQGLGKLSADVQHVESQVGQILTKITRYPEIAPKPNASTNSASIRNLGGQPSNVDGQRDQVLCIDTKTSPLKCFSFCSCQCHVKSRVRSPRWLDSVLGALFYSYNAIPSSTTTPCSSLTCRRVNNAAIKLTYFFPPWALARVIHFSSTWKAMTGSGASWTIRMPRIIDRDAPIWDYLKRKDLGNIKLAFSRRTASPFDVDVLGSSLLHVSSFNTCFTEWPTILSP
jgi:hypothetical protein